MEKMSIIKRSERRYDSKSALMFDVRKILKIYGVFLFSKKGVS